MASNSIPNGANASSMRQSARQTRTNPSRLSKTVGRSSLAGSQAGSSNLGPGAGGSHQGNSLPTGMYPGITHFSDAIDALPREFRRHNSLLNEVDGKAWALEEELSKLLTSATKLISIDYDAPKPQTVDVTPTRQVFQSIRSTLGDLLGTIDEKNHVARNANATLQRDVSRLDAVYPYVQREVSEEARLGSLTHWAYINKPTPKTSANAVNERPRRDTAGANSHRAGHGDADNEPRKEPVRRQRRTQAEIEADEARAGGPVRRGKPGPKSRVLENQLNDQALAASVAGGTAAVTAGGSKRRKVEHSQVMTATAMERSASTATNVPVGRAGSKESPAPDTVKKRTRAPNANTARKRTNTATSTASTPSLAGAMGTQLNPSNSPAPTSSLRSQPRPQQQAQAQASSRQRPSSSASNRNPSMFPGPKPKPNKPPPSVPLSNSTKTEKELLDARPPSAKGISSPRIDSLATRANGDIIRNSPKSTTLELKHEEANSMISLAAANNHMNDGKGDYHNLPEINTGVSTKRSSKHSTPVSSTYTESQQRSRPSRTGDGPKRSHKKAGSISTARQIALSAAAEEPEDGPRGAEEEDDEMEPRYCYCNEVSFGEMVACDNENCPREWFHLSCVGLTKPPSKSVVWYCNECKEGMRKTKSGNGK